MNKNLHLLHKRGFWTKQPTCPAVGSDHFLSNHKREFASNNYVLNVTESLVHVLLLLEAYEYSLDFINLSIKTMVHYLES